MKLDYGPPMEGSLVISKAGHRIELHCCRSNEELFCLVAMSGPDQAQPDKNKLQGPYHSAAQLQAAMNAISKALLNEGYNLLDTPMIWSLQAQALLRGHRLERAEHLVDTEFVPLGILPDPPGDS